MNKSKSQTVKQTWITLFFHTKRTLFLGDPLFCSSHIQGHISYLHSIYIGKFLAKIYNKYKKQTNFVCGLFLFLIFTFGCIVGYMYVPLFLFLNFFFKFNLHTYVFTFYYYFLIFWIPSSIKWNVYFQLD